MPTTHIYDGRALQPRTKKAPKLPDDVRRKRVEDRKEKNKRFFDDIDEVIKERETTITTLATHHGRSEEYVRTALGVSGPELLSKRGPNARNGCITKSGFFW
ncbi:hypothetical protein FRC03_005131 [Tulasnella sp. 419]|nr:hypothetical protein FRC03_005131 [Tulasnella sp. 419]